MSARICFNSALASIFANYLALKRSLGRRYDAEQRVLQSFDSFLTKQGSDAELTAKTFARWSETLQHLSPTVRRSRMRIIRNLCLYRRRTAPSCFVPDLMLFPANGQHLKPHIFNDGEVVRLIDASRSLHVATYCPLRRAVFRLAIVLLYTSGLRRGELARLTLGDVDHGEQVLIIRATKFHKSRHVPLSPSVFAEVRRYLKTRRTYFAPVAEEPLLIWNVDAPGLGYTGTGLYRVIRSLLRAVGIRKPDGRLPRTHDFRHSMAVNALLRWYRAGADVHSKLPLLATYMGHVSIVSTQHYLHFIDELASSASTRFGDRCGGVVTGHNETKAAR